MKDYDELYPEESTVQSIVNEYMVQYDLNKAKVNNSLTKRPSNQPLYFHFEWQ